MHQARSPPQGHPVCRWRLTGTHNGDGGPLHLWLREQVLGPVWGLPLRTIALHEVALQRVGKAGQKDRAQGAAHRSGGTGAPSTAGTAQCTSTAAACVQQAAPSHPARLAWSTDVSLPLQISRADSAGPSGGAWMFGVQAASGRPPGKPNCRHATFASADSTSASCRLPLVPLLSALAGTQSLSASHHWPVESCTSSRPAAEPDRRTSVMESAAGRGAAGGNAGDGAPGAGMKLVLDRLCVKQEFKEGASSATLARGCSRPSLPGTDAAAAPLAAAQSVAASRAASAVWCIVLICHGFLSPSSRQGRSGGTATQRGTVAASAASKLAKSGDATIRNWGARSMKCDAPHCDASKFSWTVMLRRQRGRAARGGSGSEANLEASQGNYKPVGGSHPNSI